MKKIVVFTFIMLFVFSVVHAQQQSVSKIPIQLIVGGHDHIKAQIDSVFRDELKKYGHLALVEEKGTFRIKVDGMDTQSDNQDIQFVISFIVLNEKGKLLGNDLGFGRNKTELKEMVRTIVAQMDSMYLSPLRSNSLFQKSNRNSGKNYPVSGIHWVLENMEGGKFVRLEDQSLWQISPYDRSNSDLWLVYEEIFIIETNGDDYPYQLINKNNGDTASAKLLSF
ncbi:MAG: hypothetical protein HQM14_08930 [SAR324 cluster bacterium]|nr:hypothetical protein [SAR324 cluster bacterium]